MPRARLLLIPFLLIFLGCDKRPAKDRALLGIINGGETNKLSAYLQSGGDPNRMVQYMPYGGASAPLLDMAIRAGQPKTVAFLLEHGADPKKNDSDGCMPLNWVIGGKTEALTTQKQLAITTMLIKAGVNPNTSLCAGKTYLPLMDAAFFGNLDLIQLLLAAGADPHATNDIGETALHIAATQDVASALLAAGADPEARTVSGETPAQYNLRKERLDIAKTISTWKTNSR